MKEEVLQFGKNKGLVGILTFPTPERKDVKNPTFIFLNSGFIHRVGFSGINVDIARKLASMGFVSFRMDSSGIGDSQPNNNNLKIEQQWVNEVREAMDQLNTYTDSERFVLVGNCSGAMLSYLTAHQDQRVTSAVLINPTSNRVHFQYYIKLGLFMPSLWLRLLKGKLKYKETFQKYFRKTAHNNQAKKSKKRDLHEKLVYDLLGLNHRGCRLLMIHCEWDPNLSYYRKLYKDELSDSISDKKIKVATIKGMNHDFFLVRGLKELSQLILDWSQTLTRPDTNS